MSLKYIWGFCGSVAEYFTMYEALGPSIQSLAPYTYMYICMYIYIYMSKELTIWASHWAPKILQYLSPSDGIIAYLLIAPLLTLWILVMQP